MDSHPSGNSNCSELHQVHAHSPWHFHLFILIYWLHWVVPEPFFLRGYSSLSSTKSFSERTILMAHWVLICKSNLSLIKAFSSYIIQKAHSNHDNKLSNRNSKRFPLPELDGFWLKSVRDKDKRLCIYWDLKEQMSLTLESDEPLKHSYKSRSWLCRTFLTSNLPSCWEALEMVKHNRLCKT